jgi:hypothetical protein
MYGDALAHAEVRRRCLDYMEAKAEHYRDFVAGSAPPPQTLLIFYFYSILLSHPVRYINLVPFTARINKS